MKTYSTLLALAALAVLSRTSYSQAPASGARAIKFDSDAVGSAPAGFEFARTGGGAEGNRARPFGTTADNRKAQ